MELAKVSPPTEKRKYQPCSMNKSGSATCGENVLMEKNGKEILLGGKEELIVKEGETILIKPLGGGGFGKP